MTVFLPQLRFFILYASRGGAYYSGLGQLSFKIRVMGNFREINKVNLYDRIYDNAIDNKEILYVSRIAGGQEIYSLFRTEENNAVS